mmetsp:Transcript_160934/g.516530  ORF Transcript_160934/g.516530 Transcript_160934/m.516530 type:complete len:633 (-) Transcript_160934:27-1925(-)
MHRIPFHGPVSRLACDSRAKHNWPPVRPTHCIYTEGSQTRPAAKPVVHRRSPANMYPRTSARKLCSQNAGASSPPVDLVLRKPCSHAAVALTGCVLDDVVNADDHFGSLGGRAELGHFAAEGLHDAELLHVRNAAVSKLQAHRVLPLGVSSLQLTTQLLGVEPGVVGQNHRDLPQGHREVLDGRALLPRDVLDLLHDGRAHRHLHGAAAVADAGVLHGLVEHRQRVVQGALGLVQDVRGGASEDNRARLVLGTARELDDLVLSDHHLGDHRAEAQLGLLGVLEGRSDVCAQHSRQALGALEVRMLNGHDPSILEELLGIVVDELTVDEHVAAVRRNPVHLVPHLLLLGRLNLSHRLEGVNLDAGPIDLDLVGVHLAIRHHDPAILQLLWHAHTDLLLQDEALLQKRVLERGARLLQDLDVVQVRLATQTEHGIHSQRSEVLLLVLQELGAQRGARDPEEVLAEGHVVFAVVGGQRLKLFPGCRQGDAVALDDDLRVHPLLHQDLRVPEQLGRQDDDGGRAVAALLVLRLGDVHQDLGCRVVDPDRLQDGGAVVRDGGLAPAAILARHRLEDLVHTLRAKSGLDHVTDGDRADERLQPGILASFLRSAVLQDLSSAAKDPMHGCCLGGSAQEH